MTDDSTSGIINGQFLSEIDSLTSYVDIPSRGFNQLVKAKRQGRWFMLKGLKSEYRNQPVYFELLKKEYELMVQLDHPNIAKAYTKEVNEKLGPCIVMEYIDGVTLDAFLEGKPSNEVRRKVVDQLVDALAYIHSKQILHRDLKPGNILITRNGNNVKIIDFGLSDADDYAILKQSAGTLKYMAPEQREQSAKLDCRADQYSFGLILSKLFPNRYRNIAKRCTRKEPQCRYADMEAVRKALSRSDQWRKQYIPLFAMVAVMVPLVFLAIENNGPTEANTLITNNIFTLEQKKHFNEACWYMELLYPPMKLAAEKGDGYREVLMESLRRKNMEMKELIDVMSLRYLPESEEKMQFKNNLVLWQKAQIQDVSNAISQHCKSYKEEFRLGHLSQHEYDSLEWLMDVMVTTLAIDNVTDVSASGGVEANSRFAKGMEQGLCWSTSHNPDKRYCHGKCLEGQRVVMEGLEPGTTYYVRAYLDTPAGTVYGNEVNFTTLGGVEFVPEGAIGARFSVTPDRQVWFSQGNLQYRATTDTWRFATQQWEYLGVDNDKAAADYDGWIDLFGWGTSGRDHGAVNYQPWCKIPDAKSNYLYQAYGNPDANLYDGTGEADWGYNAISNGGNQEDMWRTLTIDEWVYLLCLRNTASGSRFVMAKVNGTDGLVVFPDRWESADYSFNAVNAFTACSANVISSDDWMSLLEPAGAVFLPKAGVRAMDGMHENSGNYVSSTVGVSNCWNLVFTDNHWWFTAEGHFGDANSVRLVRDVE